MKLFVTGSNGYIGRNFIKEAIKKNHKIFAVTRKKKNKKIKNVKWLVGDIDKKWSCTFYNVCIVHIIRRSCYSQRI